MVTGNVHQTGGVRFLLSVLEALITKWAPGFRLILDKPSNNFYSSGKRQNFPSGDPEAPGCYGLLCVNPFSITTGIEKPSIDIPSSHSRLSSPWLVQMNFDELTIETTFPAPPQFQGTSLQTQNINSDIIINFGVLFNNILFSFRF